MCILRQKLLDDEVTESKMSKTWGYEDVRNAQKIITLESEGEEETWKIKAQMEGNKTNLIEYMSVNYIRAVHNKI